MNTSFQEIGVLDWPTYYTLMLVVYTNCAKDTLQVATKKCAHTYCQMWLCNWYDSEVGRCSDFETI